jgi:uncharacterized paraquat-inducible protein A
MTGEVLLMTTEHSAGSVELTKCPLCQTAIPPAIEASMSEGKDWQCPRCGHRWSALRLAAVAGYAAFCATRSLGAPLSQ